MRNGTRMSLFYLHDINTEKFEIRSMDRSSPEVAWTSDRSSPEVAWTSDCSSPEVAWTSDCSSPEVAWTSDRSSPEVAWTSDRSSPEVAWTSDHRVAGSNPHTGACFIIDVLCVCFAQFSLSNVHKGCLKQHSFLFIFEIHSTPGTRSSQRPKFMRC